MQADHMLMEYGLDVELAYVSIPQNMKNNMGNRSKYTAYFDDNTSPPKEKVPGSMLKMKGSTTEEEVDDSSWEEFSVGGERILMRS